MAEKWSFLQNPFINATRSSRKLMLTIFTDHESRLEAQNSDADIGPLHARTVPVLSSYVGKYGAANSARAIHKGHTMIVEALLKELGDARIKKWDGKIQGEFPEGTSDYTILLPQKRGPFQTGTYEQRISAVKQLGERLDAYSSNTVLAALKAEVDAFHVTIRDARDLQQQKEGDKTTTSQAAEAERLIAGILMYRNLGALMDKFGNDPEAIEQFYELSHIRRLSENEESLLTGKAFDAANPTNFLPGVTIELVGTGLTATTDSDGDYALPVPNTISGAQTLRFTHPDYNLVEINIHITVGEELETDAGMTATA